jgi:hypothetical protein
MLISRKRKHGKVVVYAGTDYKNREEEFLAKCVDSLSYLQEHDSDRYDQFSQHIGRIIGSMSFTEFYPFPRIVEVNHSEILKDSRMLVASLIVGYTAFVQYQKHPQRSKYAIDEIHKHCIKEEALFQESITGVALSGLEMLKLKQKRFMPKELRKQFLRNVQAEIKNSRKKSNQSIHSITGSAGSE